MGDRYRVLLTNRSGFYRYDTGDMVEVVGFLGQAPRLIFKGRAGLTTDLCGEKLTETFVLSCLESAGVAGAIFAFLAAAPSPHPHYVLCADAGAGASEIAKLAEALERQLRRNPQYAYARQLGQLSALEIRMADRLFARYRAWALAEGRSIGALKATVLLPALPDALDRELRYLNRQA